MPKKQPEPSHLSVYLNKEDRMRLGRIKAWSGLGGAEIVRKALVYLDTSEATRLQLERLKALYRTSDDAHAVQQALFDAEKPAIELDNHRKANQAMYPRRSGL